MATPAAKKIEVTVRLFPETLAIVDAIAEVCTNERCDESNPEPFTREHILQQCILRGLVAEEKENLGTATANPNEWHPCEPLEPSDHSDDFTNLMLALLAGAKELRARALKLHDRAETTCHDDEWEPTRAEFRRATNADCAARALLDEHKRMVERQWRFDQTPGAKKWREEAHEKVEQRKPEIERDNRRAPRAAKAEARAKAVAEQSHQNGAAP